MKYLDQTKNTLSKVFKYLSKLCMQVRFKLSKIAFFSYLVPKTCKISLEPR